MSFAFEVRTEEHRCCELQMQDTSQTQCGLAGVHKMSTRFGVLPSMKSCIWPSRPPSPYPPPAPLTPKSGSTIPSPAARCFAERQPQMNHRGFVRQRHHDLLFRAQGPGPQGLWQSLIQRMEFECRGLRYRTLGTAYFDRAGPDPLGQLDPGDWAPVAPGTPPAIFRRIFCASEKPPIAKEAPDRDALMKALRALPPTARPAPRRHCPSGRSPFHRQPSRVPHLATAAPGRGCLSAFCVALSPRCARLLERGIVSFRVRQCFRSQFARKRLCTPRATPSQRGAVHL